MKLKSILLSLALCAIFAASAHATRVVNYADPRGASKSIQKMLDALEGENYSGGIGYIYEAIHLLRGPVPGGQGYQFAKVVRDESAEPEALTQAKVGAIYNAGALQKVEGKASSVFKMEIHSPRHRGFFKNNGKVYVESYSLTYVLGGKTETEKKNIKTWIKNGEVCPIPLPGMVESAAVEILVGVQPNDANRTLIEIRALTPMVEDMKESPFHFAIGKLLKAKDLAEAGAKPSLISENLTAALDSLGYLPAMREEDAPKNCDSDEVVSELENILFLLDGGKDGLAGAKEKLGKLIKQLR